MNIVNGNLITWLKISFRVTFLLLGINVLLGILTTLLAAVFWNGNDSLALIILGAQVLPGTEAPFSAYVSQYWRFLTAAFLHGGWIHLLFNMYALYIIGGFVERFYSGAKLFSVYVLTAIGGSLLSYLVSAVNVWSSGGIFSGVSISVGASGAIFGLIGLILGNKYLRRNTYDPDLNVDTSSLVWIVMINLFLGFSVNLLGSGFAVNNWAHIGGLLSGIALGAFLDTRNTFDQSSFKRYLEKGLLFISIFAFFIGWGLHLWYLANLSLSLVS